MTPVVPFPLAQDPERERFPSGPERLALALASSGDPLAGALDVWYQPILDPASLRVLKLEALIRWRLDGRDVPACDIVNLAEASGLIEELTVWVTARATRQTKVWEEAGFGVGMAVNASSGALAEEAAAEVDPGEITFEITESIGVGAAAQRSIAALAETGFLISVDDMGAGSASLAYLKDLPISEVKIDRQFVTDLGRDPRDSAIVRALAGLSRELGMTTVVEGVETPEAVAACISLGCAAQGYWFSRPLPAAAATAWLRDRA